MVIICPLVGGGGGGCRKRVKCIFTECESRIRGRESYFTQAPRKRRLQIVLVDPTSHFTRVSSFPSSRSRRDDIRHTTTSTSTAAATAAPPPQHPSAARAADAATHRSSSSSFSVFFSLSFFLVLVLSALFHSSAHSSRTDALQRRRSGLSNSPAKFDEISFRCLLRTLPSPSAYSVY